MCKFDPVYDLVVDVMHSLVLTLIHSELEQHLLKDTSSDVVDKGGLLEWRDLSEALGKVNWYSELRDGRVPRASLTKNKLVGINLGTGGLKSLPNLPS